MSQDFDLFKDYIQAVKTAAADGDVYPQPCWVELDNGKLEMHALTLSGYDVLDHVYTTLVSKLVRRIAFGLDRSTRPGQGTTLSSVFTYVLAERGKPLVLGFVEYDGQGDVRQHDLGPGEWWFDTMQRRGEMVASSGVGVFAAPPTTITPGETEPA